MGKYDQLKGKIQPFQQEPEYQAKVDEAKISIQALSTPELARKFAMDRAAKNLYEGSIKTLNIQLEAASQLLCEQLDAEGLQKVQLLTGETCYTQTEPYSSIENRDELIAYLKKKKLTAMLVPQWQTMNAFNKECLLAGKPLLPGTKVFLKTSARLRGGNTQGEE